MCQYKKHTLYEKQQDIVKQRFNSSGTVLHFYNFFLSVLLEDSWILINGFTFYLLQYHAI